MMNVLYLHIYIYIYIHRYVFCMSGCFFCSFFCVSSYCLSQSSNHVLLLLLLLLLLLQLWCLRLILPLQASLQNQVGEISKQSIRAARSTLIHQVKWWVSRFRDIYRTYKASLEMELLLILVNGFHPLCNVPKNSVLIVVMRVLDLPLHFVIVIIIIINNNITFMTSIFEQK